MIIIVIEFMFLGINIFWALLRAHFNPRLTARAKTSLSRAQNIFMPTNINSVVLLLYVKFGESFLQELNFGEQTGTGVFPLVIAVLHYWLHYGRKLTSYHYQLTYFTLSWSRFHLNFYLQFCCSHFTKHSPFILRFIPCVLEVESCTVLDQTRPLSHGT